MVGRRTGKRSVRQRGGGNSGCQKGGKTENEPSPDRPALNLGERDLPPTSNPKSSFKFQPQHTRPPSVVFLPRF